MLNIKLLITKHSATSAFPHRIKLLNSRDAKVRHGGRLPVNWADFWCFHYWPWSHLGRQLQQNASWSGSPSCLAPVTQEPTAVDAAQVLDEETTVLGTQSTHSPRIGLPEASETRRVWVMHVGNLWRLYWLVRSKTAEIVPLILRECALSLNKS